MPEEQARQEIQFDDIALLTDREIQLLLREVDTKDLAVAMKGASQKMESRIFSNVSERVGGMIREEMEFARSVSMDDVAVGWYGVPAIAGGISEVQAEEIGWPD